MRRISNLIFCAIWLASTLGADASVQLDIPARLQWDNRHGYCGECAIQQIALFYGTYISQYRAREIIDPTQRQDVWVPENSGPIFAALRLDWEPWNPARPAPQYQSYLVWVKSHLQQRHPVIMDVFAKGDDGEVDTNNYDHIVCVTGFTSADTNAYHPSDTLVFNDNYARHPCVRPFGTLDDQHDMMGNGVLFEFCLPHDTNYGCAVTGIQDRSGRLLPVSLKVNRPNEPNISQHRPPVPLAATIQVSSLETNTAYVLLRYNDWHRVPTENYLSSQYDRATKFTATNSVQTFADTFPSDATVIYRCVPDRQ